MNHPPGLLVDSSPLSTFSNRAIIHLDLDAFFVSVECLRDERLKGIPLIIGGSGGRGVVCSCSYEARKFGIHSAMPVRKALQLCPEATVIPGDMEAYSYQSRLVTEIIKSEAPLFEKSSIDEFYIDVTGMDRFFNTYRWSLQLRTKIIQNTGLPISMGLSVNKLVSKVATNESKPNGEKWIPSGCELDFLGPLNVSKIPMIGKKTTEVLVEMGVSIVQDLRSIPMKVLEKTFGSNGRSLWNKARGIDHTPIQSYSEQKSISTECTFGHDSTDVDNIKVSLLAMVEKLCHKLRKDQKLTSCVTVKIRFSNFETKTRQRHTHYTSSDKTISQEVFALFDRLYSGNMSLRLVGVRLSHLVYGNYQINLFEDTVEQIQLFQAIDAIKNRYGVDKVTRAAAIGVDRRIMKDNNMFSGKL